MSAAARSGAPLLDVRDLSVEVTTDAGTRTVVDGLALRVEAGETVALVGESGSGKTMTALAVMGLLPRGARIAGGSIELDGRSLVGLGDREYSQLRGEQIGMVFQDPFGALNPSHRVGDQVAEALLIHRSVPNRAAARARAVELLGEVGIPAAGERAQEYPHQLSGGMRQRVVLAMATANRPRLLIADEPTTALDVTVQAEVMDLLATSKARGGHALLLITHNLGIVAGAADRVVVVRSGSVVEEGTVEEIFFAAREPYTRELLAAVPRLDR